LRFHPDGGLFASGDLEGSINLWDLTSQEVVIKLGDSAAGEAITSLSFSENGFYMASSDSEQKEIKLWDIRKNKIVKSYSLKNEEYVDKVEFDYSGNYLALSGSSLVLLDAKTLSPIKQEKTKKGNKKNNNNNNNNNNNITSVKFGNMKDEYLVSTTSSGELLIYS
jgi:pre-mRNA-processing factor 19